MVKKSDNSEKISPLSEQDSKRLAQAYKIADRPEEFAKLFCEVAKEQVSVRELLQKMVREMLETDAKSRQALMGLIRYSYKEDWRHFVRSAWSKVAIAAWTLIVVFVTAWLTSIFNIQ